MKDGVPVQLSESFKPALQSAEHFIVPNRIGGQLSIWRYHGASPKADIVLLHDATEHASAFGTQQGGLVQRLCQSGFNVWTCNLHGYGDSWPPITGKTRYSVGEATKGDLALVLKTVQRYQELPLFLLGKGTGGVLWQRYLLTESVAKLAGTVFWQHPFFTVPPRRRVRRALAWMTGFHPAWLTKQRVVSEFYNELMRDHAPKLTRTPISCYVHQASDRDQYDLQAYVGTHNSQVVIAPAKGEQQTLCDWLTSNFSARH